MGVARDHLNEPVFVAHESRVVDATRIGLAEAELGALGEKAEPMRLRTTPPAPLIETLSTMVQLVRTERSEILDWM